LANPPILGGFFVVIGLTFKEKVNGHSRGLKAFFRLVMVQVVCEFPRPTKHLLQLTQHGQNPCNI